MYTATAIYIVAIILALIALVYGKNLILGARRKIKFWDELAEDREVRKFVSRRGSKKTVFLKRRKKEHYRLAFIGLFCIVFGICVILVALGTLFL